MKTRTKLFRIFGILLGALFVLACAVGFAACGGDDDGNTSDDGVVTVPEHEHTWDSGTVTKEANCTEKGEITYKCTYTGCTETKVEETDIDPTNHDYVVDTENSTLADCGHDGMTYYVCSRCGDDSKDPDVDPKSGAHEIDVASWVVTTEPTCSEAGSRTGTCAICGDLFTETIPATGEHTVEEWTSTATCGVAGVRTGTCTECNETITENVSATENHTWDDWGTAVEGVSTRTCSVCQATETKDVSTESTDSGNTVAVLRAEAENAVIDVDESMMNYWLMNEVFQGNYISTMGFLFDIQDDATASGGQSVGYLAHGNPTLTFTINSSVAVSGAKITVHGASCDINDDAVSSVYGLMVASVSEYNADDHNVLSTVTYSTNRITGAVTESETSVQLSGSYKGSTSVFAGEDGGLAYNTWGDLTATVDLAEGDNTFRLTHDGSGVNFDYIEIEAPEANSGDVTLSFVETDNSDLVTYDPNWTAYDVVTLEAENAGCINADDSAALMETVDFVQTGEEKVINFTKGDTMVFQLLASDEIEDAYVTVNAASSGTLAASDITITSTGSFVVPDPEDPSKDTTEVSTATLSPSLRAGAIVASVDLGAGVNYIELTCASDDTLEVDNIVVDWDYVDADADYGSDHTTVKSAGRGSYVVTTVEEVVTGGIVWDIANASANDVELGGGYSLTMEAENAALINAVGVTGSTNVLGTEETTLDDESVITNVKNFNTIGNMIVFQVYASEAMTDVTIEITAANAAFTFSTATFADNDKILTVNGGDLITLAGTLTNSIDAMYTSYGTLTGTISLQQGVNYIVISAASTAITGYLNVDKIELIWGVTAVED